MVLLLHETPGRANGRAALQQLPSYRCVFACARAAMSLCRLMSVQVSLSARWCSLARSRRREPSSAPRSSFPKSCPSGWHTACRSSTTSRTASMRCRPSAACATGTRSRSRYVARRDAAREPRHSLTHPQELVQLPRPNLSSDVKDRLLKPAKKSPTLLKATQNPSIQKGQYRSAPESSNGNGSGSANGRDHKGATSSRRYFAAADDGLEWPPELSAYNTKFADTLEKIKRRHDSVVTTVAQGILEWKRKRQRMQIDHNIQAFLDRFYMSRIGIRMLIGQHIALTDQRSRSDPNYVGIICTKTNVRELAQEAIENARFVCEDHYGLFDAPKVQLVCNNDISFMYVPGHLSHMLFETLKNSLRAVVERHGQDRDDFPVTKVIVAEGKEDITIKISDEGGGIPRSAIPLVWTYMYTTVDQTPSLDPDFNKSDFKAPMAGFGYGLPISRLYARYFGGDLKLISMEG